MPPPPTTKQKQPFTKFKQQLKQQWNKNLKQNKTLQDCKTALTWHSLFGLGICPNSKVPQPREDMELPVQLKTIYLKSDVLAECLANNNMPHTSLHKIKPHLKNHRNYENHDDSECSMFDKFLPALSCGIFLDKCNIGPFESINTMFSQPLSSSRFRWPSRFPL